jgi:hypothetical protein
MRPRLRYFAVIVSAAFVWCAAASAHHSFAMFDRNVIRTFTGVVANVEPGPDHLQIFFALMNDERDGVLRDERGEPILWSLELTGAASVAKYGITVAGFPRGTVFSGAMHPARDGAHAGVLYRTRDNASVLFKCPERVRPQAGEHCDSVAGATPHGNDVALPEEEP